MRRHSLPPPRQAGFFDDPLTVDRIVVCRGYSRVGAGRCHAADRPEFARPARPARGRRARDQQCRHVRARRPAGYGVAAGRSVDRVAESHARSCGLHSRGCRPLVVALFAGDDRGQAGAADRAASPCHLVSFARRRRRCRRHRLFVLLAAIHQTTQSDERVRSLAAAFGIAYLVLISSPPEHASRLGPMHEVPELIARHRAVAEFAAHR
jgi:hypothetical protein